MAIMTNTHRKKRAQRRVQHRQPDRLRGDDHSAADERGSTKNCAMHSTHAILVAAAGDA